MPESDAGNVGLTVTLDEGYDHIFFKITKYIPQWSHPDCRCYGAAPPPSWSAQPPHRMGGWLLPHSWAVLLQVNNNITILILMAHTLKKIKITHGWITSFLLIIIIPFNVKINHILTPAMVL